MSKFTHWRRVAMFAAVLLSATSAPAFAQATRTWVSGVGDDVNPCSRTAPCKTFAGAISKTAANGEINVLDGGGFGAVTITKSITIDGGGSLASILASGTNGVNINAANVVVTLRNLTINGAGTGLRGINFLNGKALFVENVQVFGFTQAGLHFGTSSPAELYVSDSVFRRNTGTGGIVITPTATGSAVAVVDNVRSESNQFGFRVENRTIATVRNSVLGNNVADGLVVIPTGANAVQVTAENNLIASNGGSNTTAGVRGEGSGAIIRLSNNVITDNSVGILSLASASILSFGNNKSDGNLVEGGPTAPVVPMK